jgi:small nuclear ribonucleoprotein (snRNP)-like protein
MVGAFIKGRMRDKCLLDFVGDFVNLELKDGKVIWGVLRLEATGLELKYKQPYLDKNDNHIETSFIFYKEEYPNIQCLVRFFDDLDDEKKKERTRFLNSAYYQKLFRKTRRKIRNLFATVRDTVIEIVNVFIGKAKQVTPMGKVLTTQDKYVSQMQTGVLSTLNTSFEPLLENYLGKKVILQLPREGKTIEYLGILKNYTAEFLELMDLQYCRSEQEKGQKADIVVPRAVGLIRHFSE